MKDESNGNVVNERGRGPPRRKVNKFKHRPELLGAKYSDPPHDDNSSKI